MDKASFQFVLFGLMVAIVSNVGRSPAWRSGVLLLSSCIFLGMLAHDPIVFLPLAGFLLLGYGALVMLHRGWIRHPAWSIVAIVFAFTWLKEYTFLPKGIFLRFPYFTLGLSYILFRVLHLLIESGEGGKKHAIGLGAYLTYTLNFTTFVFGPIQRYEDFARDQFTHQPIALGLRIIALQLERIVRGLFKVNVLALLFDIVRTDEFARLSQPLPFPIKLLAAFKVAVAYPLFLYANLSGYMDIVIPLARLLRIRLPENFNRPFSATSFLDFWNRWHITLSLWLRSYVYNPLLLAMVRRTTSRKLVPYLGILGFFVTFFLIGIWHGRTSEFAVFGVFQGLGVAANKLWELWLMRRLGRQAYKALGVNPVYVAFSRGLTFSWFAFTMFWFWASWRQLETMYAALGAVGWLLVWLAVWVCATAVLAAWEGLRELLLSMRTAEGPVLTSRYARVVYASALGLAAFVVTVLLEQPAPDIVYKAF